MIDLKEKINRAVELDVAIKSQKKELDNIKAELQTEGLAYMDNRNLKQKILSSDLGECVVTRKASFELDNIDQLRAICGGLIDSKIKVTTEVKYEIDSKFKEALMVLYKGDYRQVDLQELLTNMGLMDNQVKLALKKLKGDYTKDKALLESFGVDGDLEEELDAIHDQCNYELVSRYFDMNRIDDEFLRQLRLAIVVNETIAVGLRAKEAESFEQATSGEEQEAAS